MTVRGIYLDNIVEDFGLDWDGNTLEVAREYGLEEVIDGFLYYNYEGDFTDEEMDIIMENIANSYDL